MKRRTGRSLVLAALLLAGLAPGAGAVLVRLPDGHLVGVFPKVGVNSAAVPGSLASRSAAAQPFATDNGTLQYNGGPVLHSTSPYVIFWTPSGESIPGKGESLIPRYFSDVAAADGSSIDTYGVIRQYTDTTGFSNYAQSFSASQAIVDTQPYPGLDVADGCTPVDPHCLTDPQLQAEIARLIATRHLPSGIGPGAPIYFVVTPPDTDVCMQVGSCADSPANGFCGYHSDFLLGSQPVVYASLPYLAVSPDPKGCQSDNTTADQEPNGDVADIVIDNMSHENAESITDPLGTAWFDITSGNEAADNCESYGSGGPAQGESPDAYSPTLGGSATAGTLYDQLINGHEYYTQSLWSNGDLGCELRPSPGAITPRIADGRPGQNRVGAASLFSPSGSLSAKQIVAAEWSFGDGSGTFVSSDPLQQVSHAYGAVGRYTVGLLLIDSSGNIATAAAQVLVGSPPRASFKFSPRKRARAHARIRFHYTGKHDPDRGVKIVSFRWSFGDGTHSSRRNPSHRFKKAGTYTVTLTVTNSLGIKKTVRHKLKIR